MKTNFLHHRPHAYHINSELSRFYYSYSLKTFGVSLVSIFIPIYIYNLGYSLTQIILFYMAIKLFSVIIFFFVGQFISWYGPKHAFVLHYIANITLILCLSSLNSYPFLIYCLPILYSLSVDGIAIDVELSKVSKPSKTGSSLGNFHVYSQAASALAPLIGGGLAFIFSYQITLLIASLIIAIACLIIAKGEEPTALKVKMPIKGFPLEQVRPLYSGHFAVSPDYMVRNIIWALFLAVFILNGDSEYAQIGLIVALSAILSIGVSKVTGTLNDKDQSKIVMSISTWGLSIIHFLRIFTGNFLYATIIASPTRTVASASRITFYKKVYDIINDNPDYRITYITFMTIFYEIAELISWTLLLIGVYFLNDQLAFQVFFGVTAFTTLLFLKSLKAFDK